MKHATGTHFSLISNVWLTAARHS